MQHEFLLAHQRSQAGSVPSGAYRDDRSVLYLGCRPRGPNRARLPTLFEMEDRPPLTTDEPRKPGLQSHSRATVSGGRLDYRICLQAAAARGYDSEIEAIPLEALRGNHVVEVGVRQVWPFVTFCDGSDPNVREVRLYIDT